MLAPAVQTADAPLLTYVTDGLRIMDGLTATDNSLFSGKLGHALLYAYAYKLTLDDAHWHQAQSCLEAVLAKIQHPAGSTLISVPGSLPSLCYLLQVLSDDNISDVDLGTDTLRQLDGVVFRNALAQLQEQNIDFLYGATGALHYLCTRLTSNPDAQGYLDLLFEELLRHRHQDARGTRFYNSHINRLNNSTDMNLGLAHGQCGLLLVLLELHEAKFRAADTRAVAEDMLRYLLGLQLPPEPEQGYVSFFPARLNEELPLTDPANRAKYNNRMGWCYGDLNVVLVLYKAARILELPHLATLADEVGAATCTRRSEDESGIENAHICHGSSSLVLCYNALLRERPLPCYLEAKAYWLERTTAYLDADYQEVTATQHTAGLLMGFPGILLVLISELLEEPTSWQRLLLF